jgi:FkbM family methyltransferase
MYFNNCDSNTNGEIYFYNNIKKNLNTIFDVGCRYDSIFNNFNGIVHYFDPVSNFINKLSTKPNKNKELYYNSFGLGDNNEFKYYYPNVQSFYNREITCKQLLDNANLDKLEIKTGYDYMVANNIDNIDFMKIDTEGYEFNVLKGFKEKIKDIQVIQFEYGGTFIDNGVTLNSVITYLKDNNFCNFSYLHSNGKTKIENLKGQLCIKNNSHVDLHTKTYVPYINDDGSIPDHYNYCNIVCINKNSNLLNLYNTI